MRHTIHRGFYEHPTGRPPRQQEEGKKPLTAQPVGAPYPAPQLERGFDMEAEWEKIGSEGSYWKMPTCKD